jgi:hypothetical protein
MIRIRQETILMILRFKEMNKRRKSKNKWLFLINNYTKGILYKVKYETVNNKIKLTYNSLKKSKNQIIGTLNKYKKIRRI